MNDIIKIRELLDTDDFASWDNAVSAYVEKFKSDLIQQMANEQLGQTFHIQQRLIEDSKSDIDEAKGRGFFPMDSSLLSTLYRESDLSNQQIGGDLYYASLTENEIDQLCSWELNIKYKNAKSGVVRFKRDATYILLESVFDSIDRAEALQKFSLPFLPFSRKYIRLVDAVNEAPISKVKLKDLYHDDPKINSSLQDFLDNLSKKIPVWNVYFSYQGVNPDRKDNLHYVDLNDFAKLPSMLEEQSKYVCIYSVQHENTRLESFTSSYEYVENEKANSLKKKFKKVTIAARQPFNRIYYFVVFNTKDSNEKGVINKEMAKIDKIAQSDRLERNQFWYFSFLRSFQLTLRDFKVLLTCLAPTFERINLLSISKVEKTNQKQGAQVFRDFLWYLRSKQQLTIDDVDSEALLPCLFDYVDSDQAVYQNANAKEKMILAEAAMNYFCSLVSLLLPIGYHCDGRLED